MNRQITVDTERGNITANEELLNDIMLACFERSKYFEQFGKNTEKRAKDYKELAIKILEALEEK